MGIAANRLSSLRENPNKPARNCTVKPSAAATPLSVSRLPPSAFSIVGVAFNFDQRTI